MERGIVGLVLDEAVEQHLELLELLRHARRAAPGLLHHRRATAIAIVAVAVVVAAEGGVVPVERLPGEADLRHVGAL